ncbi:hypothetical protein ACTFIZ_003875 [Dictyostelium cf. discoideum]
MDLELKHIKEILDTHTKDIKSLENNFNTRLDIHTKDIKSLENNFNKRLDRIENDFGEFIKVISNEKIIISKSTRSELMLLSIICKFKILNINQPLVSTTLSKQYEPFHWIQNEQYYESTDDINKYFDYINDYVISKDSHNMLLDNISKHKNTLDCYVGGVELSGSGDYLLIIKEKKNLEKGFKRNDDYVTTTSNYEFGEVYLGIEVKSNSTINQYQGISELISITKKSNGSHPILHISTNFNDKFIFSFWDKEGNINWLLTIDRNSSIDLIQKFISNAKEFSNSGFYSINGIDMYSKSLQ